MQGEVSYSMIKKWTSFKMSSASVGFVISILSTQIKLKNQKHVNINGSVLS